MPWAKPSARLGTTYHGLRGVAGVVPTGAEGERRTHGGLANPHPRQRSSPPASIDARAFFTCAP